MPTPAAVALVRTLTAVVAPRRLLVGERLLLAAPFDLVLSACPACPACLAGVFVGHGTTVETGCDRHVCQVRRAGSRPWHTLTFPDTDGWQRDGWS